MQNRFLWTCIHIRTGLSSRVHRYSDNSAIFIPSRCVWSGTITMFTNCLFSAFNSSFPFSKAQNFFLENMLFKGQLLPLTTFVHEKSSWFWSVEPSFGSCSLELSIRSNEVLIQVKDAIIRLKTDVSAEPLWMFLLSGKCACNWGVSDALSSWANKCIH